MAVYTLDRIAKDVRIALDRNMTSSALVEFGDVDTLSVDEIIISKIPESVRHVHLAAPPYLLDCGYNFGDAVYWNGDCSGWILLPEDFMRLIVFEMDDWAQPVFNTISTESPEYVKQSSRFKGIRGNSQKPVCAIAIRPEGKVLEFYSCKNEDATVRRGIYLPYPKVDDYGGIEISERCYKAVIYTTSALVLMSLGDIDKSNVFNDLAKSILV